MYEDIQEYLTTLLTSLIDECDFILIMYICVLKINAHKKNLYINLTRLKI